MAIGSVSASADAARALTLERLMQAFARIESTQASFVEHKHVAVLTEPLVYRGTLAYEAPDFLTKTFESGDVQSYEVRGDRLRIFSPDGTYRVVALETQPLVSAFIDAFRATLAGDVARLQRSYHVTLEGNEARWRLTLVPKLESLAEHLRAVVIEGSRTTIETVEVRESNGDHSVMRLEHERE